MRIIFVLLVALSCRAQILTPIFYGVTAIVGTPTDSPGQGSYGSTQTVTLSDPTANFIRYTTDGSTPSYTAGTLYTTGFSVAVTTTVKAIGCSLVNDTCGGVLTSVYTITGGGGTITRVHTNVSGAVASGSPFSITSTTAGSSLLIISVLTVDGHTITAATTSASQTPTACAGFPAALTGSGSSDCRYIAAATTGTTSVTLTESGGSNVRMVVYEINDTIALTLDQVGTPLNNQASTTAPVSPSITISNIQAFMVSVVLPATTCSGGTGGGFTLDATTSGYCWSSKIVTSTGGNQTTFTTTNGAASSSAADFK